MNQIVSRLTKRPWDKFVGKWRDEPDRVEWRDKMTNVPCIALRHPRSGHWCGYAAVNPGHPWYGKHYDDDAVSVEIHGGITFASACQPEEKLGEHRVCHTPLPGEPDDVWWFGFDCIHSGDLSPMEMDGLLPRQGRYRTLNYVRAQCRSLASQLAAKA